MRFQKKIKLGKHKELELTIDLRRYSISSKKIITQSSQEKKDIPLNKVFCIGFGKTGTTSLEQALKDFGFQMGNQAVGEILSEDWAQKRSDRIIRFCETADAFQDMPFGLPGLYKELDKAFPKSKFILTVRNNEKEWFNSLVRFHAKIFSKDKSGPPTETDLKDTLYRYKGWALDTKKLFWNYPQIPLYDKEYYIRQYLKHISDVKQYFAGRAEDLLVLNIAENRSYQKLAQFLNIEVDKNSEFPWLNKT